MRFISLATAERLTGKSQRTIWRWISSGMLSKGHTDQKRAMVDLDSLRGEFLLPLKDEDIDLVVEADQGNPTAQSELAVLFLTSEMPNLAVPWLSAAADNGDGASMQLLARCYASGIGLPQDKNKAVMWLARAAASGQAIASSQLESLIPH